MMQQQTIALSLIYPKDEARRVRNERVGPLAESMAAIGLRTPITVRPCKRIRDCAPIDAYEIVAGQHRYHAALKLKWTEIDCFVANDSALHTELWEIDENLMRAELSPAEEAVFLKRRKEIWEALNNGNSVPTIGRPREFAQDASEKVGRTKRSINEHVRRAEILGDDIERVRGTALDKGVELDALTKLPARQRNEIIKRAEAGEKVSAREIVEKKSESAPKKSEAEAWDWEDEGTYGDLLQAYDAATPAAKARFFREYGRRAA